MPNVRIKALLFDFDGLLLETEVPAYQAWREIYEEHGQDLPLSRWVACVGTVGGFDPFEDLERLVGRPVDRDDIRRRRLLRKMHLLEGMPLRPGARACLEEARTRGLKVGIVTSSPVEWVTQNLASRGLSDGWDCIECANEDHQRAKPQPFLYLGALERLGIGPDEAVAFEDSPNGIRAAKAAGIFCVAVPNPVTAQLDLTLADLRLESLADLSLGDLLDLVAARQPGPV